jgi:hypothetical protein
MPAHPLINYAIASLKAFQAGYQKYELQVKFQREQEQRMQQERLARRRQSQLDHQKLQMFRDEFDRIHTIPDPRHRGNAFEALMNEVFDYFCDDSKGTFQRNGEQIDGLFYFDNHWYYVEVRWTQDKVCAHDISVLRDRAREAFGGDTKALFVSFNGFSDPCLKSLQGKSDERVILMDGCDLHYVLDGQIAFDVLLARKQADLVQNKRPFVRANDLLSTKVSQAAIPTGSA